MLKVTDAEGCSSSTPYYNLKVESYGPQANFYISENPVLPDQQVNFINISETSGTDFNTNTYTWKYGDGTELTDVDYATPGTHSYPAFGDYEIKLIAKNAVTKCEDTAYQTLRVKNVNLSFTYALSYVNPSVKCPPVLARFTNTSENLQSVKWDFGDGATSEDPYGTSHTYLLPGRYTVSLTGYHYDGTSETNAEDITIDGPYATLKSDKLFACGAEEVTLMATTGQNTATYTWDFGDGTLSGLKQETVKHNYLTPGTYTPSLIVQDDNKCSFPFFLDKPVVIDTLHIAITKKPDIICDGATVLFTPDVVSVASQQMQQPLTWLWNFGTGSSTDIATTQAASFTYNQSKTYTVSLSATSPYGCVANTTADVTVSATPTAAITAAPEVCQDGFVTFTAATPAANGNITWMWDFANGNSSLLQNPPPQQYSTAGANNVSLIISNNGCANTVYHSLLVNEKPLVNITPKTPQLCVGSSLQLQAHDGVTYKWYPINKIDNATVANPLVSPASDTKYYVDVTNSKGCFAKDSVLDGVTQHFTVAAPAYVNACKGTPAQLTASGADKYVWLDAYGLSNTGIANPVSVAAEPQLYRVVGYDNNGCFTDTAATQLLIKELPAVNAGADVTVFAGAEVPLTATASTDVLSYSWLPGDYLSCTNCASPVSRPQANMQYVVQVKNQYGCVQNDTVLVNILCRQSLVQIPTGFTPNGDNNNDRFSIKGQGVKLVKHFIIYSRSGDKVFERNNIALNDAGAGWDGTAAGMPMAAGSYIYMVELVCATGEIFNYKGTVVLIR